MIAIYVRQSLDKKDSLSIDIQIEFCKKEVSADKLSDIKIYTDKGFSGKNTNRPAFSELKSDIEAGKIEKLIVYRLDRISRSITDFANIIDFLKEHKVDFISANEKFDTSAPIGKAMLYIIMIFAQLERETIAERIKDNYYSRGKQGIWLGGPAPLGFDIVNKIINNKKASILEKNEEIKIVKEIFKSYAETNKSLGSIAKDLSKKYGGMWSNVKISRILHNPIYVKADADIYLYYKNKNIILANELEEFKGDKGCMLYGKRNRGANKYNLESENVLAIAKHKGVIDSNTFLTCQYKLSKNKQIKNTGKGKYSFLTGILKCGYCGYGMRITKYKDMRYANCTGRQVANICTAEPTTHYVDDIEEYIFENLLIHIDDIKNINNLDNSSDNSSDNNNLKIDLIKIEQEIEDLLEKIPQANDILIEYINKKITDLDSKKKELVKKLDNSYSEKTIIDIPNLENWTDMSLETKRTITHNLIESIILKNDEIFINWKY